MRGSAVLVGTMALYLVYVGVKDVPFTDGLRSLFRGETPQPRQAHAPYAGPSDSATSGIGKASGRVGDVGIDKLKGNAVGGYNKIRGLGNWKILGWGLRPDASSDHPKGLAIDVMNPTDTEAQSIISAFRSTPGAKYWIWKRQIANAHVRDWAVRPYSGISPHTDHVHLSWE